MHLRQGINTSGATDEYLAVIFRIQVDESFAAEHTVFQAERTGETRLFVHGEEALDSGVLQVRIADSGQRHRDTDTVVGAEGRPLGL